MASNYPDIQQIQKQCQQAMTLAEDLCRTGCRLMDTLAELTYTMNGKYGLQETEKLCHEELKKIFFLQECCEASMHQTMDAVDVIIELK